MKRIFRSIINIKKNGQPTIPYEELSRNYKIFVNSHIYTEDPSYTKLYHWIEAHQRKYKELPSIELLYSKAEEDGDESVIQTLKEIVPQLQYTRADFRAIVEEKFEEQNKDDFQNVLTKTWQAASSGLKVGKRKGKKEIKGIASAIDYFAAETRKFRLYNAGIKTESQIRSKEDSDEVVAAYDKRKKDPINNLGLFSFLDKMDDIFRGTKLGELEIIAAYVGQGKTTLAANLAYNGVYQGLNGLFISVEMNFDEMRDMFFVLHTSNADWVQHKDFKKLTGKISYEKVRYGELEGDEENFFKHASDDFGKNKTLGKLFLRQPTQALTPSQLEMELYDRQAELAEEGENLDFVVIDYVGLMIPDKNERYGDFNTDLNNIIKHLKNLAIVFNEGRGLRVITPFQVNREGWKDAMKHDGVYKLTALSNANEAERSADKVISLYMNEEMRKSGMMKVCCLKHRKGAVFMPFEAKIDFITKKTSDFINRETKVGDGMDIQSIEEGIIGLDSTVPII